MGLSINDRVLVALEKGPTTAVARVIYAYCKENPGASLGAVQKATGCSRGAAQVWVRVAQIEAGMRKGPEPQEAPAEDAVDVAALLPPRPPATPGEPAATPYDDPPEDGSQGVTEDGSRTPVATRDTATPPKKNGGVTGLGL